MSVNVPAFRDSIDAIESFAIGKCGEKQVDFDFSSTPFLSMSLGEDPLTDDFSIHYDKALATEADIGIHEVLYHVSLKEYGDLTFTFTASFTFEISVTVDQSFDQALPDISLWPG